MFNIDRRHFSGLIYCQALSKKIKSSKERFLEVGSPKGLDRISIRTELRRILENSATERYMKGLYLLWSPSIEVQNTKMQNV